MVCILAVLVSLSPADRAAAQQGTAQGQGNESSGPGKTLAPPIDLDIGDIKEVKEKVDRIKPLIEKDRELTTIRVREIEAGERAVPRIQLAHGYGTVITLPFQFELANVALGNREKFQVDAKGNSLIIFPLQEFKATNLVVFENTADGEFVPHHYLLIENSQSGVADFTVKVNRQTPGSVQNFTDAVIKALSTQRIPDKETTGWPFFEGRAPVISNMSAGPFMRKLTLLSPDLTVYMVNGRVTPLGDVEWSAYPDGRTTIMATKKDRLTVRRISDGKTFTSN